MKLTFSRLTIQDFKNFRGRHVFNLRAYGKGLHFVRGENQVQPRLGSNGAGKSTLWDALLWGLFGVTIRGLKNPDIMPWHSKSVTPTVKLNVRINRKLFRIKRTANPNSLTINGQDADKEAVEKLLGMSASLMTNTIILGQGRPLFFDLKPREKMELFTEALSLDRWDDRSKMAAEAYRLFNEKVLVAQERIYKKAAIIQTYKDDIVELNELSDEWQSKDRDEMDWKQKELDGCRTTLDVFRQDLDKYDLAYDAAELEYRHLRKQVRTQTKDLANQKANIAAEKRLIADLKAEMNEVKLHLKHAKSDSLCPKCNQPVKGHTKVQLLADLDQELHTLRTELKERTRLFRHLVAMKVKASVSLKRLQRAEEEFADKSDAAKDKADRMAPRVEELRQRIKRLEKELDEVTTKNPYTDQIRKFRKRIKAAQGYIERQKKRGRWIVNAAHHNKYWVDGFKEIRLYILEEVLQELELATNSVLGEMGLVDWRVMYEVERETKQGTVQRGLNVVIFAPGSSTGVKWEAWSGGEGQRLRLAGTLALAEVLLHHAGIRPAIEILDEPTRHLSPEGVRDVYSYLASRAQSNAKQVWYVDHQSVESAKFASTTTIVNNREGSHIRAYD